MRHLTYLLVFLSLQAVAHDHRHNSVVAVDSQFEWELAATRYGSPVNVTYGYGQSRAALGSGQIWYRDGLVLKADKDWEAWCCGYVGDVVWSGPTISKMQLSLVGIAAFGFEVEPQDRRKQWISVRGSDGAVIRRLVDGSGIGQFFGFVDTGMRNLTITNEAKRPFAIRNFYYVGKESVLARPGPRALPPTYSLKINTADMVSNMFIATITGVEENVYLDWLLNNGTPDPPVFCYGGNCENFPIGSSGTYTTNAPRPSLPASIYSAVDAYVGADGDYASDDYVIPGTWLVVGRARHSVYNTPSEASCEGDHQAGVNNTPAKAYLVTIDPNDQSCVFSATMLGTTFMQQTTLNGTGSSVSSGDIKPLLATSLANSPYYCQDSPNLPADATVSGTSTNNVFVGVSSVTGACNIPLSDTTVAARPVSHHLINGDTKNPNNAMCGDNVLPVDSSNNNLYSPTRTVEDVCPACTDSIETGGPPIYPHFDNYTTDMACFGHNNMDQPWSPAWTADVRSESQ
jgi:hypothetical protein